VLPIGAVHRLENPADGPFDGVVVELDAAISRNMVRPSRRDRA
jgi:hypothetical protein